MKKVITILLICIAVPVYIWDAWLIIGGMSGKPLKSKISATQSESISADLSFANLRIVHFEKKGKSPFIAYKVKPKPVVKRVPVKKKKVVKKPKTEAKPPRIKITGIMWNPSNPIAMVTLPNGTSTVARVGQTIAGSIEVKKIEKNRMQIVYKGNVFWIRK